MKVRDVMSGNVVRIHPEETVAVAARTLTRYNIGVLPVCGNDGKLCGVVTDRDLVTRCVAAERRPENTRIRDVMSPDVVCAVPEMDAGAAAHLMGKRQIRRLPVVSNGRLCGMVSLGDLAANQDTNPDAGDALGDISSNLAEW